MMKNMRLKCFFLCMSLMMLWACNQEQVLPDLAQAEKMAAVCDIPGVIQSHECGLIITLEDGSSVYATSYPGNFKPQAGMAVKMAFTRITLTNATQSSGCGDGNCGDENGDAGNCGTSNHNGDDAPPSCMEQYGITPVYLQCITDKDS
jgi:hypothetical protein